MSICTPYVQTLEMTISEVNTHRLHTVRQQVVFGLFIRLILIRTDRVFVATMYTSDADNIMRYTDEVRAEHGRMIAYLISSQGRDS